MTWWDDAVGRCAQVSRVFTAEDVDAYRTLTGDACPAGHVPEPLIAGLFSTLLGVELPGAGTNYLKQRLELAAPAAVGEQLQAVVEVRRVRPEKQLVYLSTVCTAAQGRVVCRGDALVLARGVTAAPGAPFSGTMTEPAPPP